MFVLILNNHYKVGTLKDNEMLELMSKENYLLDYAYICHHNLVEGVTESIEVNYFS